jgi:hypothetical protein
MALDYIIVGISMVVFIFYLIALFLLFDARKRLEGNAKVAFTYFIIAFLFLVIRRLQQIFLESQIVAFIPYFADYITLIFAILFTAAVFYFHKAITSAGGKSKGVRASSKPFGIKILLWGLAILIAVNLLARFEVIQLVGFQSDLLSLITLLFVATEIGVKSYVKEGKKKLDVIGWFGVIIIAILFLALITSWLGLTLPIISILKQTIESALLVFVIIEIFR